MKVLTVSHDSEYPAAAAAAAANSLQSCPTLCDPIDGSSSRESQKTKYDSTYRRCLEAARAETEQSRGFQGLGEGTGVGV